MVKCADCGYLGIWDTGEWLHADEEFRQEGILRYGNRVLITPRCFAVVFDLRAEQGSLLEQASVGHVDANKRLITKGRDCGAWVKWQPGFTPREHREMIDAERLREWQAKREDADREWRDEQRREDREWRERQEERAARTSAWDRRSRLAELALAAIGIGVASFFVIKAANIQADAQLRATKIQIDAFKAVTPTPAPPINE